MSPLILNLTGMVLNLPLFKSLLTQLAWKAAGIGTEAQAAGAAPQAGVHTIELEVSAMFRVPQA
jgi:hypothetical protein